MQIKKYRLVLGSVILSLLNRVCHLTLFRTIQRAFNGKLDDLYTEKKSLPVQLFRWFIPGWREKLRQRHKTAIWHFNLSLQSVKGRLFVAFNSLRSYLNLPCHEILAHVIVVKTRVELIFTLGCSLTMKGETTSDCKQKL